MKWLTLDWIKDHSRIDFDEDDKVLDLYGEDAEVLTVTPPTGMTMRWIGDDPTALEANKTYEINIMDGAYGVVMSWT